MSIVRRAPAGKVAPVEIRIDAVDVNSTRLGESSDRTSTRTVDGSRTGAATTPEGTRATIAVRTNKRKVEPPPARVHDPENKNGPPFRMALGGI